MLKSASSKTGALHPPQACVLGAFPGPPTIRAINPGGSTIYQLVTAVRGYVEYWNPLWVMLRLVLPGVARQVSGPRVGKWQELRDYDLDAAAIGGLVRSAVEFAPFLIAHLNEGRGLLSADSARQMQTLVTNGPAALKRRWAWGWVWKIGQVQGCTFLKHEGGGAGFMTETRLYPQDQNRPDRMVAALQPTIADLKRAAIHTA